MGYPENRCGDTCESSRNRCAQACTGFARREMPCILYAVWFLIGLAVLAIGLLLGAVYYETFLPVAAAVIAFAAALLAIAIALLIYYKCVRRC